MPICYYLGNIIELTEGKSMKKILVVGDSISKGVVFDEIKNKYVLLKENFINLISEKTNAQIINASKFGSTVKQGELVLKSKVEKHDPDIVVIELGGNDCDFSWDEVASHPEVDHKPKTPLLQFEKGINRMLDFILSRGKTPVLSTLPPLYADNYFKWFTQNDEIKGKNVLKWLRDVWRIYWWQERYSNCIQYISKKRNVLCIDIRRAFLSRKEFDDCVCIDGIHLNSAGHKVVFEEVFSFMRENAAYLIKQ